jgi:hypothetical protein
MNKAVQLLMANHKKKDPAEKARRLDRLRARVKLIQPYIDEINRVGIKAENGELYRVDIEIDEEDERAKICLVFSTGEAVLFRMGPDRKYSWDWRERRYLTHAIDSDLLWRIFDCVPANPTKETP